MISLFCIAAHNHHLIPDFKSTHHLLFSIAYPLLPLQFLSQTDRTMIWFISFKNLIGLHLTNASRFLNIIFQYNYKIINALLAIRYAQKIVFFRHHNKTYNRHDTELLYAAQSLPHSHVLHLAVIQADHQ